MKNIFTFLVSVFLTLTAIAQTPGNALHFDGTDDYFSAPLPTVFNNISGNDFTVETWVNPDLLTASSQRIFFAQLNSSTFVSILLNTSYEVYVYVYSGGSNSFKSSNALSAGIWSHIAFSWETSSQQVLMYIDGNLQTTTTGGTSTSGTDNVMTIGSRSDGTQNFNGEIDDFRIWDYARSACEILASMNSDFTVPQSNLVAYYNFNQGAAGGTNTTITTLNDFTGNYNGTLNNFALTGAASNFTASGAGITQTNQTGGYNISVSEDICAGGSFIFGSLTLTNPGLYSETFLSSMGCDSVVNLTLSVITTDTSITQISANILQSNASSANYQWLDCNNNFSPIPNEINSMFTSAVNGDYAVEITQNDCVDTSACYNITFIDIANHSAPVISIYPNPVKDKINIELGEIKNPVTIKIYSTMGQLLLIEQFINFKSFQLEMDAAPGLYHLIITTPQGEIVTQKIMKD